MAKAYKGLPDALDFSVGVVDASLYARAASAKSWRRAASVEAKSPLTV